MKISTSTTDSAPSTQVVPSWTGSPQIDTAIRYAIILGSGVVTTWIVAKLKISDPNIIAGVGAAVLSASFGVAAMIWGFIQNAWAKASVVDHVTNAALTGMIPANVVAAATPAQEVKITDALNAAQLEQKP